MSREIDARVAVEVMGTPEPDATKIDEWYPHGTWMVAQRARDDALHPGWILGADFEGQLILSFFEPRPFSTSIADAWLVVEKMNEIGVTVSLSQTVDGIGWGARFSRPGPVDGTEVAGQPIPIKEGREHVDSLWSWEQGTAAEAICLAALKAVEAQP